MTKHSGPEYTAPDDIRCEAIVAGDHVNYWEWKRIDHRCPNKSTQTRADRRVCYQHARNQTVKFYGGDK